MWLFHHLNYRHNLTPLELVFMFLAIYLSVLKFNVWSVTNGHDYKKVLA